MDPLCLPFIRLTIILGGLVADRSFPCRLTGLPHVHPLHPNRDGSSSILRTAMTTACPSRLLCQSPYHRLAPSRWGQRRGWCRGAWSSISANSDGETSKGRMNRKRSSDRARSTESFPPAPGLLDLAWPGRSLLQRSKWHMQLHPRA